VIYNLIVGFKRCGGGIGILEEGFIAVKFYTNEDLFEEEQEVN